MIISALVVEIHNMTGSMAQNVAETAMNITTSAASTSVEASIEAATEVASEVADVEDGMIVTDTKITESETGTALKGIDEVDPEVRPVTDSEAAGGTSDLTALHGDRR